MFIGLANSALTHKFFDIGTHPLPVEIGLSSLNYLVIAGMTHCQVGVNQLQELVLKGGIFHNPESALTKD
jgi:hypothetical protein